MRSRVLAALALFVIALQLALGVYATIINHRLNRALADCENYNRAHAVDDTIPNCKNLPDGFECWLTPDDNKSHITIEPLPANTLKVDKI